MGLKDSCADGSLWVLFLSFWIFIIGYIIYLCLRGLRSLSRPQHHAACISPKLFNTDRQQGERLFLHIVQLLVP